MYEKYYHLDSDPFALSPDPRFSYLHPSYKKAKTYIKFALERGEGFLLITGKPGTGKTTLVKEMLSDLDKTRFKVSTLVTTQLEADDLLRYVAYSYDLPVENANKATVIQRLKNYLIDRRRREQHTILIVDEAQDLSKGALEELRLLTNFEMDYIPLLQIFLVGQPQLFDLLGSSSMEQLRQRITVATAMQPLSVNEIENYIECRLTVAGWQHDPEINRNVYPLIYENTDGIPRRVNQICSRLLLHGFVEDKHELGIEDIEDVIKELNEEQISLSHTVLKSENEFEKQYISLSPVNSKKELH
ncbi:ExeA family protein [Kaarinaea lacus]